MKKDRMMKDKVMYQCSQCDFSCTSKAALKEHSVSHSAAVQKCTVCNKQFINARGLKLHMKIHNETNVADDDCKAGKILEKGGKVVDNAFPFKYEESKPRHYVIFCEKSELNCPNKFKYPVNVLQYEDAEI